MRIKLLTSVAALCAFFIGAADNPTVTTQLWEHRNLGKAFYENPDTHQQAAEELRKALQVAPTSVREHINYGLGLLRAGQTDAGIAELIRAQKQDPSLPHTWFNLGIAYKHAGDYDKAIEQFQGMIRLIPNEPTAHYNLAASLRSKNDNQAALPEFLEAERLNGDLAGPHFQLFTLYQRSGDKPAAMRERQLFEDAKKKNAGAAVPEDMEWCFYAELYDPPEPRPSVEKPTRYHEQVVSKGWDTANSGMQVIDAEGSGHADLLVWSRDRVELWKRGVTLAKNSGLEGLKDLRDIAPGDFDNDGLMDLCVVTGAGAAIFHNNHGVFAKQLDLPKAAGTNKALAIDYDHDNDLDLLLLGSQTALLRNDGNGKFEDKSGSFPTAPKGKALDAVVMALRGDTAARDIVVSYADRGGVLYTDKLNGVFEASELPAISAGSMGLDAQDFDHDGLVDVVVYQPEVYAVRNREGTLELARVAKTAPSRIRADFNGDEREDYARLLPDGSLHLYTNDSADGHWLSVRIEGVKNLKSAMDATVEVKSGPYYDKRVYGGVPLSFATDGRTAVDTVRITWPNGLIQNETGKKSGEALKVQEAQRLSGSCPMIFTWNGQRFQFITDVLGVAPLGASSGDGHYFPVDHDEYVQIPGSALQAQDGKYQVHITEELHEISYLDQVRLIALDHPADVRVYTNDKFKSPPYPEFQLFGGRAGVHPVRASDDAGQDVTAQVAAIDGKYPDGFPHNSAGVAGLHTLDLDFGKAAAANRAVLVLNGWVDWADGSTFLGASQDGRGGLVFPYLQVKDKAGKWRTVVGDMGIPSGKPKTISVDLTGKFLSSSREVRIVTNLCVYWDEVFLLEDSRTPPVRLTPMDADRADLQFRGFSQAMIDPRRQQPEKFLYDQVRPVSNWNPTPGFYTRYGDVRILVNRPDDKLLIMGSGDEVKLEYPASSLPPLPQGWTRDFLLLVDGWAKDADANTAFSQSVTPLPFHAMSAYPYKQNERFPNDPEHAQYEKEYLTRPALRLIRPLASAQKTAE